MKKAVIKRENIENNINVIKSIYKNLNIIGVIKANAYGHGAKDISKLLYEFGIKTVAVATFEEAKELLSLNIDQDVIILGPSSREDLLSIDTPRLIQTITSESYYHEIGDLKVRKQVNVNTGMNRFGLDRDNALLTKLINNHEIEGIYTHFLNNEQHDLTTKQIEKLRNNNDALIVHTSITDPDILKQNNIKNIRAGLALYGYEKFEWAHKLKPILSLYAKIINIMEVPTGASISYNATYVAKKNIVVGTVAIGYADGLPFNYKNGSVFYKEKLCRILGRITMDYIMVDLSEVDSELYDYVEIFGENISATKIAEQSDTIVYEILTRIGKRVVKKIV